MISAIRGQKESIARATAAKGSMRPEPNTVNRRRKALVMLCKRVLWRLSLSQSVRVQALLPLMLRSPYIL